MIHNPKQYLNLPPYKFFLYFRTRGWRGKWGDKLAASLEFSKYSKRMESIYMSRKANRKQSNNFSDYWFVPCRLGGQEKKDFDTWSKKHGNDFEVLWATIMQQGFKQSCSYDNNNGCFIASATLNDDTHPDYGAVITSRAGNPFEAVALNIYKILVVLADAPLPREAVGDNWG